MDEDTHVDIPLRKCKWDIWELTVHETYSRQLTSEVSKKA